jgi:hypothetical protein
LGLRVREDDWGKPGLNQTEAEEHPYNQEKYHDPVRRALAFGLVVLLGVVIAATFITYCLRPDLVDDLREISSVTITGLIGLFGLTIGYYFSGHGRSH